MPYFFPQKLRCLLAYTTAGAEITNKPSLPLLYCNNCFYFLQGFGLYESCLAQSKPWNNMVNNNTIKLVNESFYAEVHIVQTSVKIEHLRRGRDKSIPPACWASDVGCCEQGGLAGDLLWHRRPLKRYVT